MDKRIPVTDPDAARMLAELRANMVIWNEKHGVAYVPAQREESIVHEMLQRARLVREVLVCVLLAGALVLGILVATHRPDARPAYCFAGDARANAEECRR